MFWGTMPKWVWNGWMSRCDRRIFSRHFRMLSSEIRYLCIVWLLWHILRANTYDTQEIQRGNTKIEGNTPSVFISRKCRILKLQSMYATILLWAIVFKVRLISLSEGRWCNGYIRSFNIIVSWWYFFNCIAILYRS